MRRLALALLLTGCADRSAEVEADYTQEVARACTSYCVRGLECVAEPTFETSEECVADCTDIDALYESSDCGEAFRDYIGCMGDTQTCEDWDAADQTVCANEVVRLFELACGSEGENEG